MQDTSEERSLPASRKKLDDARKKGQVAKSQDLVSAIALFAATLYVVAAYPGMLAQISALTDLAARSAYEQEFSVAWPRLMQVASQIVMNVIWPLLAVVAMAAIVANMIVMRGLIFSTEPIKPNFDHVNPAAGFKRIFSAKSVVEFLKAIVKVAALAAAFLVVFGLGLQALMQAPACGMGCVHDVTLDLLRPMAITAIIVFLMVGAVDVVLQRQLFLREMRMTKTEAKREFKDLEGDPRLKRERRRQAQEFSLGAVKVGLKNASLLIGQPGEAAVGIRFVRGETPVPIVACRGEGVQANILMTEANLLGIPVVRDGRLAREIMGGAKIASPVPDALFQPVADLLVAAKLV